VSLDTQKLKKLFFSLFSITLLIQSLITHHSQSNEPHPHLIKNLSALLIRRFRFLQRRSDSRSLLCQSDDSVELLSPDARSMRLTVLILHRPVVFLSRSVFLAAAGHDLARYVVVNLIFSRIRFEPYGEN
jgi:hypothetical protein